MTKESTIEKNARHAIEKAGGWMMKFVSPGLRGVPDDICIWPTGQIDFIEFKQEGEEPNPSQYYVHERLRSYLVNVEVLDSQRAVNWYIEKRKLLCQPIQSGAGTSPAVTAESPKPTLTGTGEFLNVLNAEIVKGGG